MGLLRHSYITALHGSILVDSQNLYLQRTFTLRVHWSLPSGGGMDLGMRSGTSYSPTVAIGDGKWRFWGSIFTDSCLATCHNGDKPNTKTNLQTWRQIFKVNIQTNCFIDDNSKSDKVMRMSPNIHASKLTWLSKDKNILKRIWKVQSQCSSFSYFSSCSKEGLARPSLTDWNHLSVTISLLHHSGDKKRIIPQKQDLLLLLPNAIL